MKKSTLAATLMAATLGIVGCASAPDKISASYVSPLQYQNFDCDQVGMELMRVNRKVVQVSGAQAKEAQQDAVAVGVGLVLFWPALFFLADEDRAEELAHLKGEYEALESVAITKRCDIAPQLAEAKKQREQAEAEAKAKLQQQPVFES